MTKTRFRTRRGHDERRGHPDVSNSRSTRWYRQNGKRRIGWRSSDDCLEESLRSTRSCLEVFVDIYRHHAVVFARYCAEGRCSVTQLRTIEALYIDGMSLREFAAKERVTPQAISTRIDALANKAPEFYRWWRRSNTSRQRGNHRAQATKPKNGTN